MSAKAVKSVLLLGVLGSIIWSGGVFAAPAYKVNMRLNLKGQSPISVNTVARSGKKSYVSQFSDDGQVETLVEVLAKKSQQQSKKGLLMEVLVTRRVRGQERASERVQIFAPENQEMEVGMNAKGRMAGNISLAVMAHKL
ncbi:MAG: hypothetical protein AAGB31_06795 [Bdellovibrio sp.]